MDDHQHAVAVDQSGQAALVGQSLPFTSVASEHPSSHVGVQYTQHLSPETLETTASTMGNTVASNEAAAIHIDIEQINEPSVVDYNLPLPQPADEYDMPLQHSDDKYNLALQLSSTSDEERLTDDMTLNIVPNVASNDLDSEALVAEGPINQIACGSSDLPGAEPSQDKSTPIITHTVVTRQIDTRYDNLNFLILLVR